MNAFLYLGKISALSWRMTRNELPLAVFLSTFAIRIVFQAVFFVWVAKVIGGPTWMAFALYGNLLLPAIQFLFVDVYNVLREEIDQQRLDLLLVSESPLLFILVGRTLPYLVKTVLIAGFTCVVVAAFLLHRWADWLHLFTALPVISVFSLSGYAVSIFLSSLNMSDKIGQMLPNLFTMLLMLLGDFTIPVDGFPRPLQWFSDILPLRHAVDAFRAYMVHGTPYWTNPSLYIEVGLLVVYAAVGYGVYLAAVSRNRRNPVKL